MFGNSAEKKHFCALKGKMDFCREGETTLVAEEGCTGKKE